MLYVPLLSVPTLKIPLFYCRSRCRPICPVGTWFPALSRTSYSMTRRPPCARATPSTRRCPNLAWPPKILQPPPTRLFALTATVASSSANLCVALGSPVVVFLVCAAYGDRGALRIGGKTLSMHKRFSKRLWGMMSACPQLVRSISCCRVEITDGKVSLLMESRQRARVFHVLGVKGRQGTTVLDRMRVDRTCGVAYVGAVF